MAAESKPKTENSLSEQDVDCICGMLMQLNSEIIKRIDENEDQRSNSLYITRQDKTDASKISHLISVILSEKNSCEKETDIKGFLESVNQNRSDQGEIWDAERSEKSTDVNIKDAQGRTPLIYAVSEASWPIIQALIRCDKIDLLIRDRSGNTALMYASVRGYDSIVRSFMNEFKRKYKKDSATLLDYLDAENDDGETAFTLALKNGHEDCAIALSEYLKEALEKEERRVTSLAYRMGLNRGKSESRMSINPIAQLPNSQTCDFESNIRENDHLRRRSSSPKKVTTDTKSITLPSLRFGRRGRDVSRYFANDQYALLDEAEDGGKGSPEIKRSSPVSQGSVGIHVMPQINVDVRVDHHHRHHYQKSTGRFAKSDKSKNHRRRMVRCEKHQTEEKRVLCREGEEEESVSGESE